jgi:hypothetical protein
MGVSREELCRMIDTLPVAELPKVRRFLERLQADEAEELSSEDIEAVRRGLEDVKAGRTRPWADLRRELEK